VTGRAAAAVALCAALAGCAHAPPAPVARDAPRFAWPVAGTVRSAFGPRGGGQHHGIDIAAPHGTPIVAAGAGEVVLAGRQTGYGRMVVLRHAPGLFTLYAHASELVVREGEVVERGAIIARVGRSGNASGPHLHFEVREGARPVDPLPWMEERRGPSVAAAAE
jgi:murein DD-endopeptidase MepM/ murein hydrolase activator NlpD